MVNMAASGDWTVQGPTSKRAKASVACGLSSPPHFASCCARVTRSSTPRRWCHRVGRSGSTLPMPMWSTYIGCRARCCQLQTSRAFVNHLCGPFTTCGLSVARSITPLITGGGTAIGTTTAPSTRVASISIAGPGSAKGNIGDGPADRVSQPLVSWLCS